MVLVWTLVVIGVCLGLARGVPAFFEWVCEERWRRRPQVPDVLLSLELARLATEIQSAHESVQPHQAERLAASRGAYDLVLLELCDRAGIPRPPGRPPLDDRRRLDVEASLIGAGYSW